jgi:carbohydrate-binding DOMON domain-containing protein
MVLLQNYGQEQLNQTFTVEKTEGTVIPNGMYDLNQDYFLGDLVSIKNGFIEAQTRVIEIIYSEDENGWALTPTFSSWEEDD